MSKRELTGKRYGRLVVIEHSHYNKKNRVHIWKCKCDCGNTTEVWSTALNRTKRPTKSCGCLQRESRVGKPPYNILEKGESNIRSLYYSYTKAAKKRKKNFELTIEEFKEFIFELCHYCDSPAKGFHRKEGTTEGIWYNGIDRVDPSIGYVKENCVTSCKDCNYAKLKQTKEEFIIMCKKVYLKAKERKEID